MCVLFRCQEKLETFPSLVKEWWNKMKHFVYVWWIRCSRIIIFEKSWNRRVCMISSVKLRQSLFWSIFKRAAWACSMRSALSAIIFSAGDFCFVTFVVGVCQSVSTHLRKSTSFVCLSLYTCENVALAFWFWTNISTLLNSDWAGSSWNPAQTARADQSSQVCDDGSGPAETEKTRKTTSSPGTTLDGLFWDR